MTSVSLLHTADMHSRLNAEAAQQLREVREENHALLLDSGDAIAALNVTVRCSEPTIELMNAAGYTAMAIGNREYFFRKRGMLHKTRAAGFATLSANIQPVQTDMGHIKRWTTVTAPDGSRVGLFGLTPTMIAPGSWVERLSDMRFLPYEEATQQAVGELRGQVDWLIALSHLGKEHDRRMVELFPQIDLILGGHSHPQTTEIEQIIGTLVSYPRPYAREAVLITLSKQQGTTHYDSRTIELL
jgi:2',3'-cyclic-nucleotide 2'-phosphodiesterase (5'-nucleotidase family)